MIVPRTCSEISAGDADRRQDEEPRSVEAFRDAPAYVLLGDPGAGKTTAFETEREAIGEQACLVSARDFLTFDPQHHPEWRGKTLFIDGLDEIRAGASDSRTPFDAIRGRLDMLGKPRFRLSCREADWLGATDRNRLEAVSPGDKVTVLRLNPLTDSDIVQLLAAHPRVDDAEAFIAEADRRGIGDLLRNPQTLDLLAKAVAGDDWPESRKETFEMACGQMVREHNDEHSAALASSRPSTPGQLLDAAGRLCAIQLVAGKAGYTLHGKQDSKDKYPTLEQCGGDHPDRLRLALATKLFKGESDNRFTPVHRHVAEFLGARHLANVIDGGLPAKRVIALITGADGTVVTELRGLSAWLAAHCPDARADLIERDPIGVGLYGDVRGFSLDEKRALLESLERDGSRIYPWLAPLGSQEKSFQASVIAFGTLAAPDMEPALKEALQDSNRGQGHQRFTDLILEILSRATPLPRLAELLLEIVRDDTRWPHCKESALRTFMRHCPDSQDKVSKLKTLLADIQTGSVSDSDDNRLLGILLTKLYPDDITPSEIWSHFAEQEALEPIGKLWWLWEIVRSASDEHAAEFLDDLHRRFVELRPALELHHEERLPLSLLARGLQSYGDQLDTVRLYDWLGVGEVGRYGWSGGEDADVIRCWLEQRPEVQKALCLEGLNRWPNSDDFNPYVAYQCLYHATLPPDFGLWCLKQAEVKENTELRLAKYLVEMAYWVAMVFHWSGNEDGSLEKLVEYAQKSESRLLKRSVQEWLVSRSRREEQVLRHQEQQRTFTEEQQQRKEEGLAYVRSNEAALRENHAAPALLHQLAQFYFRTDSTSKGPAAVEEVLQGNQHLTQAVLQGFRGAVERQDVPALEEILRIRAEGRMPYLAWPFLAGLAEIESTTPEAAARWDDDRIRKALALYFSYGASLSNNQPTWYQRLLLARSETVAEVQVKYAVSEFRIGRAFFSKLRELAHDKAHAQVAERASLPLLRAFPTRCKLDQLGALDYLLWAAIQYADDTALWELIERKLSRTSMNNAQHVHWLAAGFVVAPEVYQAPLSDFVQGHEKRVQQLAEFFCQIGPPASWFDGLGIQDLARFIRLVGGHIEPELMNRTGWVTPAMKASRLVYHRIQRDLAVSPDKDVSDVLAALLTDPALSRWHDVLSQAQDTQRIIRRDADYRHPTIEQVCQTLDGGTPANPGDLAALVTDRLDELAVQIRKGNTDDWRQYWEGLRGQSPTPKHEDDCRDALLSDLQQRLPQGIDAQPEGHYANDKRADVRVSYGGFQVPVEVKKNAHRDVWRAMQDQLMAQYTSAPETDGYGIYLVFWFGKEYTKVSSPENSSPPGKYPADAEELKKQLEATLSPVEARKISVCVVDVSRA